MFVLFVQIVFPVSPNIFHFPIIPWYHAQNVKQPLTPKIHLNIIVSLKEALSSSPSQSYDLYAVFLQFSYSWMFLNLSLSNDDAARDV